MNGPLVCLTTVTALLLAGCGAPAVSGKPAALGSVVSDQRAVATLPTELSGFRRAGQVIDYEREPNGAGLGASVRYVPVNGEKIVATIYLYSGGRFHDPEGGSSPDVAQELRSTAAEVNALMRIGRYRGATFEGGMDVGALPNPDSIRCATFRVVQSDNARTGDAVCVAVRGGEFVKTRVTVWNPPEPAAAGVIAAGLLDAVRKAWAANPQLQSARNAPTPSRG